MANHNVYKFRRARTALIQALQQEDSFLDPEFCIEAEREMITNRIPRNREDAVVISGVRGFCYLIRIRDTSLYKIGVAADVEARLAALQIANPSELEIEHLIAASFPTDFEQALHKLFYHRHVRGEWFKLTRKDVRTIKVFASALALTECEHIEAVMMLTEKGLLSEKRREQRANQSQRPATG